MNLNVSCICGSLSVKTINCHKGFDKLSKLSKPVKISVTNIEFFDLIYKV